MFHDEDLAARPHPTDRRGRGVREHGWLKNMLGVEAGSLPLPACETRIEFIRRYVDDAGWEEEVGFFKVRRSRARIMVRRIAHTAHHRGQQMAILRMLNRELYSNYGPTADTGGLPHNQAPVIYAHADLAALLAGGPNPPLPAPSGIPVSERP